MGDAPDRPLVVASPREDVYGCWWRTAVKLPVHPRGLIVTTNVPYGPEPRHRLDVWRTREDLQGAHVDESVLNRSRAFAAGARKRGERALE